MLGCFATGTPVTITTDHISSINSQPNRCSAQPKPMSQHINQHLDMHSVFGHFCIPSHAHPNLRLEVRATS
jgi:hypothetical protein